MEFDKARGTVFPGQAPHCVFDDVADGRLDFWITRTSVHPFLFVYSNEGGGHQNHLPRHRK